MVLVVEDHEELRQLMIGQLNLYYKVAAAGNGREALTTIAAEMPDLIISDLMMPELNGLDLCKTIKNDLQTSHIPFILLTARGSEHAQIAGYGVKADAYITKPFNMELLLIRVSNLLEQQEKRKALFKNALVIPLQQASASAADERFIKRVLGLIEKNLDNPDYSVEDLSSDMNMDRTGLYRKLVAVTGQVPSLFIRNIRLKKAAQLILYNEQSVASVAQMTGFRSAAYFSRCFLAEFGVRPSDYFLNYQQSP